jgi:predicted secreted protein
MIFGNGLGVYQVKAQTAPRIITLTEADNNREIKLKKSDILVLKLKAQFGTGYSWQFAAGDDKLLKLVNQTVEVPDKSGESGYETQVFRFKAKQAGKFELELRYVRVWEKEVEPLKKFRLKIQINKSGVH